MSMLCALKKEHHHLIAWLCLVSHSLPLHCSFTTSTVTFDISLVVQVRTLEAQLRLFSDCLAEWLTTQQPHHLKNSETKEQFQKYEGRVVLRGGVVKHDYGSFVVFLGAGLVSITNEDRKRSGRSCQPSWMSDCLDALDEQVTPYPQTAKVKMEDAPMLLKISRFELLEWKRLPRYNWRKTWQTIEELFFVPLDRKLYGDTLCRIAVGKEVRKRFHMKMDGRKRQLGKRGAFC